MEDKTVRLFTLIACTLASFLTPFMGSSVNVALPLIAKEFNMDALTLNWVATSYLLAAAVFLVPFGRLADIYGRKKIFTIGIIIYTITSFILGFSFNTFYLLFVRVLQGIGSSMIFSTSVALLTAVYPPKERGKAMGILVTAVYIGTSIGPVTGGFLTHYAGWRSLFFINALLGLIAAIFVFSKMSLDGETRKEEKFDLTGSVIFGISLSMMLYGFSKIPSLPGLIFTSLGLIGIFIFFRYELKHESPVLDVKLLLNNRVFAFSNLAALINYSATFAVGFLLSLYLQYIRGLKPDMAGLVLISQPLLMAISSPITGRLSDKIEPRILATAGMTLTSISLFFFFFLTPATPIPVIVISLVVIGLGFGLFSSPNMNAIMSSIDKKYYGVGSAMQSAMRLIGQMMSMGFAMIIFSVITGKVQIKPEAHGNLMTSINAAFLLFAILCFVGIFMSVSRGNLRSEN